jgi:hypothetical protein
MTRLESALILSVVPLCLLPGLVAIAAFNAPSIALVEAEKFIR